MLILFYFLQQIILQIKSMTFSPLPDVISVDESIISNYFVGYIGIASALVFSAWGGAYGSYKAGAGIYQLGIVYPKKMSKALIPVIMCGVLAIYGLIVAVILTQKIPSENYTESAAYSHLASGLCVGLTCLGAGIGIGHLGGDGARAAIKEPKTEFGQTLMLIFVEAIGLYGLIMALILAP